MRSFLALTMAIALLAGCTGSPVASPSPAVGSAAASKACASKLETGPLPEWARAGFSGDSSMPHVLGDRGEIVAALFGYPPTVSRTDGVSNKILWVSRVAYPTGDLVIEARLDGTATTETRRVQGGPGPSIIDLPKAGCWQLTLTWPEHTDTMALLYR